MTIHFASFNDYGGFAKYYRPNGIFHPMKVHYFDDQLYTPFTVHVIAINCNSCLTKNDSPFGTLQVMKE